MAGPAMPARSTGSVSGLSILRTRGGRLRHRQTRLGGGAEGSGAIGRGLGGVRRTTAASSSIVLRLPANWLISFFDTSPITLRPNWAILPVICRSVVTMTDVLVGERLSAGRRDLGGGVAAPAGVAALGLQHRAMGGVVAFAGTSPGP